MLTVATLTSMAEEVDTVNMPTETSSRSSRPYHHGRLRDALVDAGLALARTEGPEAVVLRAATRAAGVSHNAAYRHFADRDELLRAVCERCMSRLALLMEQRIDAAAGDPDPVAAAWARLDALGRAYVEFAVAEPGWFRTAFAVPRTLPTFAPGEGTTGERTGERTTGEGTTGEGTTGERSGEGTGEGTGAGGLGPFGLLRARLDELVEVGAVPPDRRPGAEYAAWSAVHGLSTLLNDGPLRDLPAAERERALQVVLDSIARGL
jgi:AcrR family transcriptional regulator